MTESDEAEDKLGIRYEDLEEAVTENEGELPPAFQFMDEYFPDKEDIGQKGRLNKDMPANISSLRILEKLYPELMEGKMELGDTMDAWMNNLEKRLISVDGKSREEFKEILEAMLSGLRDTGQSKGEEKSVMRKLFTTKEEGE